MRGLNLYLTLKWITLINNFPERSLISNDFIISFDSINKSPFEGFGKTFRFIKF